MGSDWYGGTIVGGDDEGGGRERPTWSAPENEVPVPVDVSAVIGRADDLAIFVGGFRVYSNGVEFTVSLRRRRTPTRRHDVMDLFMGHYGELTDPEDQFLLGFEFADGTRVTSGGFGRPERGPQLNSHGGGGGGRGYDKTMWLTPLPPPGELLLVCTWLRLGIEETRTVLDATAFVTAAAGVEELWPWEPEPDEQPEPLADVPVLPGWFGETSG
ncbi:hypothetical protein ACIB24_15945 [Spongisporangium articulatum]|uniref:Uncharacterized protein n=1 Tax=Spongisporangium articulatum TaxID=3362603 RepID=A0ABW8ARP8_9ACTN